MDEQQIQQQIIQLVQAAMQGDQQANQYIQQVMQAAQQGDQQAQQLAGMIQQVAQQIQGQQAQMARRGAKLNYIRQLRGTCPEGYEMEYFKQGGTMGKRCKRCENASKKQDGGEVNPVDAFKCGRKMKKVKKAQYGTKQESKRPFTGFEGFSYEYHSPRPSNQGRADRPEEELIYNNGKYVMGRERYYDPDLYEYYNQLYPIEDFIYSTREFPGGIDHTPIDVRTLEHLKRHALNNQDNR